MAILYSIRIKTMYIKAILLSIWELMNTDLILPKMEICPQNRGSKPKNMVDNNDLNLTFLVNHMHTSKLTSNSLS